MSNRRKFLKAAGAGVAGLATIGAPAVHAQSKTTIKWRLQTYAGPALRGATDQILPQRDPRMQAQLECRICISTQRSSVELLLSSL